VKIRVRLFAVAKELSRQDAVVLDLPEGSTVKQLRGQLAEHVPALAAVLPRVLFAVGTDYAADDTILSANDEVACIPPVSGG
jgi:molybdopterin converting factor subunit 1